MVVDAAIVGVTDAGGRRRADGVAVEVSVLSLPSWHCWEIIQEVSELNRLIFRCYNIFTY